MKRKKPDFEKLMEDIREAKKDPEFMLGLKEFIKFHTGKSPR